MEILGVPIDVLTQHEALREIASFFTREGKFHISTPNPEMLVEAKRNPEFREVLRRTSLNLADGVGLVWALKGFSFFVVPAFAPIEASAGRRFSLRKRSKGQLLANEQRTTPAGRSLGEGWNNEKRAVERITGVDTMIALCSSASRICQADFWQQFMERRRVFLLGAAPGIAERAAAILTERNRQLRVVGTFAGSPREEEEEDIVRRINEANPTLLFVAYGAPSQDLWIARNLPRLQTVKVAMSVGGAFDFIVGKQKRAPRFLRNIGLEWLWRLVWEPRRIKRIWNAVVVFPLMILMSSRVAPSK